MERSDFMNKVREIQLGELSLLKNFIAICSKHDLRYYALGGTLLGAIRHKGFIPWDDDMDLGMPRKDYEKFLSICKKELPEHVILRLHDDNLGNTSIMDTSLQIPFGDELCSPFIDIFPLDGYPDDRFHYFIHTNKIKFYRALSKISVIDRLHDRDRGSFENAIVSISKVLKLNKLLKTATINNKLQNLIKQYDFETSSIVGNVLGSYRERELARKEVFGEPQLLEFENLEISCHANPDEYLTKIITHELERKEVPEYESKTSSKEEKTFVGGDGKTYYTVANEDVDFDGEKTETIVMKSEEDYNTPHVVDYKKVSEEVRKYLIELRKINGIDIPVPEVTDKALKYAKARSDEMIAKDELSHDTKLKKSDFGLRGSTENASAGTLPEKAIESEKELAYNLILRYFNDYSNASAYGTDRPDEANRMNYGHRIPLLSASGTGIAVGSSFDKNSQYGNYGTLQFVTDDPNHPVYPTVEGSYNSTWHLAKAENKDSDPDHSEFYYNGKRVKFLPKTTFVYVWNETTHPKNPVYAKAKEALDTFNAKQAKDEATISQKLATLNAEYDTAKNILEKDRADLKNANDRVADLTKDNEEKVKTLKLAQSELAKQNDELVNAQTNLEKQESELRRLKTVKGNTFNLVKEAEKTLTKAKTELEKAQQYVSD